MQESEVKLRCLVLDALVLHSGKTLTADLIGQITTEIVQYSRPLIEGIKNEKE